MDDYCHEDCDFCHDAFGDGRDLVKHEALEHGRCEVCQMNFGGPNELQQVGAIGRRPFPFASN